MGFASGFNAGAGAVSRGRDYAQQREQAERQKVIDGREDAEYTYKQKQRAGVDAAWGAYDTAAAGVGADQQRGIQETYGMTPGQMAGAARTGGGEGLRSQLASYDAPDAYDMQTVPAAGAPRFRADQLRVTEPDELGMERAMGRVASATRDIKGLRDSNDRAKNLEFDGDFKKYLNEYKGDEDQVGKTIEFVNGTSGRITMGEPDKNGLMRLAVVKPDKRAEFTKLSKQEQATIYAGARLMQRDPQKALTLIAGVNKTLAAAVAEDNNIQFKLGKENNDGAFQTGQLRVASERNGIARAAAGSRDKHVDPKYVAQLNDLNTRISESTDPAEVKKLEREYQRVQTTAYTALGKVAPLKDSRPAPREVDPKAYAETLTKFIGAGMPPAEARMETDVLYGRSPAAGGVDSKLQSLNKERSAARRPVIVRPGEVGMRDPSQPIMGDPRDFVRTGRRGVLGGMNYGYEDPVTGKIYSTEEYNRLLNE